MATNENGLAKTNEFILDKKDKAEMIDSNFVTRHSEVVIKSKEFLPPEMRQSEVQGRVFPSKPHDLTGLPTLLTPKLDPENKAEAEKSIAVGLSWRAIENSQNILVAHACNISSLIRILNCHYNSVLVNKLETAALIQASPWITLLAREVISGSLVDLSNENTMKTTAHFGFLFNVPVECIWQAASRDLYIPMESTVKGPYDPNCFREIFKTTLDPDLNEFQIATLQAKLEKVDKQYNRHQKLGAKYLAHINTVRLQFYEENGLLQRRGFMPDVAQIQTPQQILDGLKISPYSEIAFLQETSHPNTFPKIRGVFIDTDLSCLTHSSSFTVSKLFRTDREIDKTHEAKFYFEQAGLLAQRLGVPLIDFALMRKLAKQRIESLSDNPDATAKTLAFAYDTSKKESSTTQMPVKVQAQQEQASTEEPKPKDQRQNGLT